MSDYPIERIRSDFPALQQRVGEHPLTYLDNAATSLKPRSVIDSVRHHYEEDSANIHRGVHTLSERATREFESVRDRMQAFIHAAHREEIIFTSGTTAGINLVANAYADRHLSEGDEIIISHMEHHSNIVPWQMLRDGKGCVLKVVPITDEGELDMDAYADMLGPRTKLVSMVHVSNSLGTVNPISQIIEMAHAHGAHVLVDAAQAVPFTSVDVQALNCDFLVCSGHKLFGPTGVGVLYGKRDLLEDMPPFLGGGDMILSVTFEKTTYNRLPHKFEAGTPHIAGVIGLGPAIDYVTQLGLDKIEAYEDELLEYANAVLSDIPGVRQFGTSAKKAPILSFLIDDIHPHDIGSVLDTYGIAIRAGHHCTQPVMQRFGIPATARASFSIYNTREDADRLGAAIREVKALLS
jgi:cysteine desulfurase/selenocysteine lyase